MGCPSTYARWRKNLLKRMNYSVRKHSVCQVVPHNWREIALEAILKIRAKLCGCDVVVNADQTFVLYNESKDEQLLVPTGTKRVSTKQKTDTKTGFTVMCCAQCETSLLLPPFIVFKGKNMADSEAAAGGRPNRTLHYKYKNWANEDEENTATITFQENHWFDASKLTVLPLHSNCFLILIYSLFRNYHRMAALVKIPVSTGIQNRINMGSCTCP